MRHIVNDSRSCHVNLQFAEFLQVINREAMSKLLGEVAQTLRAAHLKVAALQNCTVSPLLQQVHVDKIPYRQALAPVACCSCPCIACSMPHKVLQHRMPADVPIAPLPRSWGMITGLQNIADPP